MKSFDCLEVSDKNLSKVLSTIEEYISQNYEKLSYKAMLVCDEILTNQLTHSDFEGKEPQIKICINPTQENTLSLVFIDNAKEFNPLKQALPDITTSLEETKIGGLGIFLVKQYSKNISYTYENGFNILKVIL